MRTDGTYGEDLCVVTVRLPFMTREDFEKESKCERLERIQTQTKLLSRVLLHRRSPKWKGSIRVR